MSFRKCGDTYRYSLHVQESRIPSLSEARRFEKIMRAQIAEGRRLFTEGTEACVTILGGLERFLEDRRKGINCLPCNDRVAASLRRRLLRFDRVFHSRPLSAIATGDVMTWVGRRLEERHNGRMISRDTVNKDVEALKAYARWAQWKKLAPDTLPLLLAPRLHVPGKVPGKNWATPEYLELDELLEIIDAIKGARRDVGLMLQVMLYYNLRPSEAAALERRHLRMPEGERDGKLRCYRFKTKTTQRLTVPAGSVIHGWLSECLDMAREARGEQGKDAPLIICIPGKSRRNPGGWTSESLYQTVRRICRDLGIEFHPYIVRHSIISWLDDQPGVAPGAVTAHASHAHTTTTDTYRHAKAKQAGQAFEAIETKLRTWFGKTG